MYRAFASLLAATIIAATGDYAHSSSQLFKDVDLAQVEADLETELREEINYELSKSTDAGTPPPAGSLSGGLRPIGLTTEFIKPKGTLYDIVQVRVDESSIFSGPWFKYDLTFFIRQETPFFRTIRVQTTCSTRPKIPSFESSVDFLSM